MRSALCLLGSAQSSCISFGTYLLILRGVGVKAPFAEHSLKGAVLELSLAQVSVEMAVPLQRGPQVHCELEPTEAGAAAVGGGITLL